MTATLTKPKPKTPAITSTLDDPQRGLCDTCGQRGYVWLLLTSGFDLVFCGHHYSRNEQALIGQVVDFDDRRSLLAPH